MIENKSFFEVIKLLLQKLELRIKAPFSRLAHYAQISRLNYTIDFVNEGSVKVCLPNLPKFDQEKGRDIGVFSAVIGEILIEI